MRRSSSSRSSAGVCGALAAAWLAMASPGAAQLPGATAAPTAIASRTAAVAGVVRDTAGRPVRMAAVLVENSDRSAVTDDSGRFHVDKIPAGKNDFSVRRIGYALVAFSTTLAPDSTLVLGITMTPLQNLDPVRVTAERETRLKQFGFTERMKNGLGSYITPAKVDSSWWANSPATLLRDVRGLDVRCSALGCAVRPRIAPYCLNLFVNGGQIAGVKGTDPGALDGNVNIDEVYAIEVYERPSIVPAEFQGTLPMKQGSGMTLAAGCGAIAVWTRGHTAPSTFRP